MRSFSVEVGATSSPVHTASGRLLLAHLGQDQFRHFCVVNADYGALTCSQRKAFHAKLGEIRRKDYSFAKDETTIGIHDISVLVGNPRVGLTAALAVAFLTYRGKKDKSQQILSAARACATAITKALGLNI